LRKGKCEIEHFIETVSIVPFSRGDIQVGVLPLVVSREREGGPNTTNGVCAVKFGRTGQFHRIEENFDGDYDAKERRGKKNKKLIRNQGMSVG